MFSKNMLLLASAALITFSSCKKEETQTLALDSQTLLLTSGKWKMVAETTAGTDSFQNHEECETDNTFAFGTDGKATFDEGATKCDATAEQTTTGSWAFSGTEKKKVILTETNFALEIDIMEINSTTMKWSYVHPIDNTYIIQTFAK